MRIVRETQNVYAFLITDSDGNEKIATTNISGSHMPTPLIALDGRSLDLCRHLISMVDLGEKTVRLVKFSQREELEVIHG